MPHRVRLPRYLRWLPWGSWWPRVSRESLRLDAMAGLAGAIILLPQGMAYAVIAGLPPEYGIYAALVPPVVAALFGSSWHLVSGPTAAISIVVFAAVSPLAVPGSPDYLRLVFTLTLMVGLIQLALGLARMGAVVNFISHSVVLGFTAGAAFLIASSQLGNFFGIPTPRGASFYSTIESALGHVPRINPFVAAVGAATLASGIAVRKLYPRLPYMIVAMLVGSLVALALDTIFGEARTGIRKVGAIPSAIPPLSMPDVHVDTWRDMSTTALALALLGLTEAVSIARAVALRSGQMIHGNQEFIGQGLSNIAGALFSGYASSGSFTRSGVNFDAGARTPLATVFASGILLVMVLAVAPLAAYLPIAAMSGILFLVAWGLIDLPHIRAVVRTSRAEATVLAVTFVATLTLHLEFAIYAGVLLSLLFYLDRTSKPLIRSGLPAAEPNTYHLVPREQRPECPQLKILFIDGSIYFGAVNHVQQSMQKVDEINPSQKHLLLAARAVNFIDMAGGEMIAAEARRRRALGGGLYFHNLQDRIVAFLRRSGAMKDVGEANIVPMGTRVAEALYPRLDTEICRGCRVRAFDVCQARLPNGEPRPPEASMSPGAAAGGSTSPQPAAAD